jgi:hypothetical protein
MEDRVVTKINSNPLADIDPRLLSEAFRRARAMTSNATVDSDQLLSAIFAEARRGARDMFSLIRATQGPGSHDAA